jgi:hypothetical protein
MQSLQLHLTNATWSWLSEILESTIGNWNELMNDDTKQGVNSSGLQMQSVVAGVNFSHEGIRGLYRTLRE